MTTGPVLEMPPDADAVQQANGDVTTMLPRRSKTRQGKVRLLTLDALDARTAAAQAARRLIETLSSDLGGEDQLTAGEKQLVTRVAMTGAIVADFETRWIAGQQIELGNYLQACRTQCRLLALLGLQRRQHDVTPDPLDYAREHEAA